MSAFGLKHDEFGRLVLIDADGERHVGVEPVRAFPISEPNRLISIVDGEGREVAVVPDLADLAPAVRTVLEADLARREFLPIITKIHKVQGESHPTDWDVATDRGPSRFTVNGDDDVRHLGDDRALIVDAQGIRYLIPDTRALDLASRRILEIWL